MATAIACATTAVLALPSVPSTAPVPIRQTDASAEPSFAAPAHEILWADDFDDSRRAALGRYVTLGEEYMRFDARGGVGGTGALRLDWTAPRGAARCADDSRLIEASFEPSRELFVQFAVRYSPGFRFDWGTRGRCAGNAKKLFLLWADEGSRFVFISENGALGVGSDHDHPLFAQRREAAMTPAQLADGKWHRITFHIVQGSAPGRADGSIRGWIDGVERWSRSGIVTHNAGGYYLFKMPATFNQGSPVAQSEWVDALRVWRPR